MVRLQRSLIWRRNYDLPTTEIDRVKLAQFYERNYQPVYGIEIGAGHKRIRFGSTLADPEKDWLCSEIRQYLGSEGIKL